MRVDFPGQFDVEGAAYQEDFDLFFAASGIETVFVPQGDGKFLECVCVWGWKRRECLGEVVVCVVFYNLARVHLWLVDALFLGECCTVSASKMYGRLLAGLWLFGPVLIFIPYDIFVEVERELSEFEDARVPTIQACISRILVGFAALGYVLRRVFTSATYLEVHAM
jgi:hypothetical protein